MEGEYNVYHGRDTVGKVKVMRKGLYYRIACRCRLSGERVCRLTVKIGEKQENLGIPVPEGERFLLEKMIPIKRLGDGIPEFYIVSSEETPAGNFVPICPEEPFRYIERLKESYLAERNGRIGAVIP